MGVTSDGRHIFVDRELTVPVSVKQIGLGFNVNESHIREVISGSWAAEAGLQPGDEILSLNGVHYLGLAPLTRTLTLSARPCTLQIRSFFQPSSASASEGAAPPAQRAYPSEEAVNMMGNCDGTHVMEETASDPVLTPPKDRPEQNLPELKNRVREGPPTPLTDYE
ncbi:unnamed protein product [Amoebophrya sp. A25]|nr:unnamed protein product [Amoebophrya sp. A25]|eukprot:GSA25T00000993001.1